LTRNEPFRGAAGVERFARSVAERHRGLRRVRSSGPKFLLRVLRRAVFRRPWPQQRIIRVEPHVHVNLFGRESHWHYGAEIADPRRKPRRIRGPGVAGVHRLTPALPLSRAFLRHPLLRAHLGTDRARPAINTLEERLDRHWTTVAESSVSSVVRRLLRRVERVDAVTTTGMAERRLPGPPGTEPGPTGPTSLPVPVHVPVRRVVRRSAPEVVELGSRRMEDRPVDIVAEPVRGHAVSVPAEHRVSVEKLTDQVVKAIDRRLIAHRERMGRI
jgi:hypothetical protein